MIMYNFADVDEDALNYLYESPCIVTTDAESMLKLIDDTFTFDNAMIDVYTVSTDTLEDYFDLKPFDKTEELQLIRVEDLESQCEGGILNVLELIGEPVQLFSELIDENMSEKIEDED